MASENKEKLMETSEVESSEWIIRLPDFILGKIFSFMDNDSKFNVALTCTHFNYIVNSDPEVYKTFKLTYNPEKYRKFDITQIWSRPVPTVNFINADMTHEESEEFADSILGFFRNVGKFVKSFEWQYGGVVVSQVNLFKILNEIPNAESFDFFGTIKDAPVEDLELLGFFEVKHQFKHLKTLKFRYRCLNQDISTDILDGFFGNAINISSLLLCEYLNLLYNKPKLEKVHLVLDCRKIIMREPSADYKICGNLKNLIFAVFSQIMRESFRSVREFENLGNFFKSQNEIVDFDAILHETKGADVLSDIFQHVLGLKTIRYYEIRIHNSNANNIEIFCRNSPYLEVLKICNANPSDFVQFFPNLKRLTAYHSGYEYKSSDYEAINQLKLLEELYIQLTPGYEILEVKNLKKLVIFATGNTGTLHKFGESFLKNHPNIVDFAWHSPIELDDESNKQLASSLKSLQSLKRFCCTPRFDLVKLGDVLEFLQVFLNGADALETLVIRIKYEEEEDDHEYDYRKIMETISFYMHFFRPSLKLEYQNYYESWSMYGP